MPIVESHLHKLCKTSYSKVDSDANFSKILVGTKNFEFFRILLRTCILKEQKWFRSDSDTVFQWSSKDALLTLKK